MAEFEGGEDGVGGGLCHEGRAGTCAVLVVSAHGGGQALSSDTLLTSRLTETWMKHRTFYRTCINGKLYQVSSELGVNN